MRIYAFIDSQNLNLSIKDDGWTLDFARFRLYLREKYGVDKAFLFIGYVSGNKYLYENLRQAGYRLIFKPVLGGSKGFVKGNCDAELVLHCMIEYQNFDKAIIVSGDGDFCCLIDYLKRKGKLVRVGIPNKRRYSSLLKKFRPYFFHVSDLKGKLRYKKR